MVVGNPLAGKGHPVPGNRDGHAHHGDGLHGHHGEGAAGHGDEDDDDNDDDDDGNLSAISLRASPRTLSDWWREASALKYKHWS